MMLLNESKVNAAEFVKIEKKILNLKKITLIIFFVGVVLFVKVNFFFLIEI